MNYLVLLIGKELDLLGNSFFFFLSFPFLSFLFIDKFRYFYWIGMWIIGLINLVILISGLISNEPPVMIFVVVFVPIFSFAELILLRIFCELAVVVLLFPYYFKNSNQPNAKVTVIEDPNDSDMDVSLHRQLV